MADLKSLEAFPPKKKVSDKQWDKEAKDFMQALISLPAAAYTKQVNKQDILDVLNPAVNSLSYLFALNAHIAAVFSGKDRSKAEDVINHATVFFASFDPIQIRYAGEHWLTLTESCFDLFNQLKVRDYSPLATAIVRLDSTGGTFTSNHLRLVRACIAAGVPSQALLVLDKNIYAFPSPPTKNLPDEPLNEEQDLSNNFITEKKGFTLPLKSEFVLEYFLLGAHVYTGLRNFSRARLFLEYVILTPSVNHGTSMLQMEAYKRWILIGLLAEGKRWPLPRANDQQVIKSVRATSKAYEALAEDFEKRDVAKFHAEMDVGKNYWREDGNQRLVKEVADALLRFRVVDLQKTYAALPVSRVATLLKMQPGNAQQVLAEMIRRGQLNASIANSSAGDAVLRFHLTPAPTTSGDDDLEAHTHRIETLVLYIKDADRRLRLTTSYVEHEKRAKRAAAGPDGDLAEQMDLSWDPPIAESRMMDDDGDEDIMAL